MEIGLLDTIIFIAFITGVVAVSVYASRRERTHEDYFLAGRNLKWWAIGISLIASCLSTEQLIGMNGQAYGEVGLAVAAWALLAAVAVVLIALFIMPVFLQLGICTMPEFLEHRFGGAARTVMAIYMMILYVVAILAVVLFTGATALQALFGLDVLLGVWLLGLLAGGYTIFGGLKAVVWSDFIQGITLFVCGGIATWLGLRAVGGFGNLVSENREQFQLILPADHAGLPWTGLVGGIWIAFFFYWGFNQFITQRTLAARSLAHGQKGMMLAGALLVASVLIIVLPGLMAHQLYADEVNKADQSYAVFVKNIMPVGLRGIFFAAIFGALMSSLDSILNSASTIFTMDLYRKFLRPEASEKKLIRVGRITTSVFVVAGCLAAPFLASFTSIFDYLQSSWGYISPPIVGVFVIGILVRRAPPVSGLVGLLIGPLCYGLLINVFAPRLHFLHSMLITLGVVVSLMLLITAIAPLKEPVRFEAKSGIDLTPSPGARWAGGAIVAVVALLYLVYP
ncbi:MAG: solute:sodium symporter family transporter [Roseibacillus sp.]|nr:solute:sodium symporter family transporter [Roseibacillus sp.]